MEFAIPHIGVVASGLAAVFEIARLIYTSAQKAACFKDDCKKLASYVHRVEGVLYECEEQLCDAGEAAAASVAEIKEAFLDAKALIVKCSKSGRVKAIIQAEDLTHKFQSISMRICNALNLLPFHQMKIANQQVESIKKIQHDLQRVEFAVCKGLEQQSAELRRMVQIVSSSGDQTHTMLKEIMEMLSGEKGRQLSKQEVDSTMKELREEIQTARANKEHLEEEFMKQVILLLSTVDEGDAKSAASKGSQDSSIPRDLLCPISFELMLDPVILVESGHTYDRPNIEEWLRRGHRKDPCTGGALAQEPYLISNITLRKMVHQWLEDHADYASQLQVSRAANPPSTPNTINPAEPPTKVPELYPAVNPTGLPAFTAPPTTLSGASLLDPDPELGSAAKAKARAPQAVLAFHMGAPQSAGRANVAAGMEEVAPGVDTWYGRNFNTKAGTVLPAAGWPGCKGADRQEATSSKQAAGAESASWRRIQQLQAQLDSSDSNQQVIALVALVNMCKSDLDAHGVVCHSKVLLQLVQLLGQQETLLIVLSLRALDVLAVEGKPEVHQLMAALGVVQAVIDVLQRHEARDADLIFQCVRVLLSLASSSAVCGMMVQAGLVPQLTHVLSSKAKPEVLKVSCQVLCRLVYDPATAGHLVRDQDLLPVIAGLMRDSDEQVRSEGLLLLGQLGEHPSIDEIVVQMTGLNLTTVTQLLGNENAQVRGAAISKLQDARTAPGNPRGETPPPNLHPPPDPSAAASTTPLMHKSASSEALPSPSRHTKPTAPPQALPAVPPISAPDRRHPPSPKTSHPPPLPPSPSSRSSSTALSSSPRVSMAGEQQRLPTPERRFTRPLSQSVGAPHTLPASADELAAAVHPAGTSFPIRMYSETLGNLRKSTPVTGEVHRDSHTSEKSHQRKASLPYSALMELISDSSHPGTTAANVSHSSPRHATPARKCASEPAGIDLPDDESDILASISSMPCISRELTFAPRVAHNWVPDSPTQQPSSQQLWLPLDQISPPHTLPTSTSTSTSIATRPSVGGNLAYSMLTVPDEGDDIASMSGSSSHGTAERLSTPLSGQVIGSHSSSFSSHQEQQAFTARPTDKRDSSMDRSPRLATHRTLILDTPFHIQDALQQDAAQDDPGSRHYVTDSFDMDGLRQRVLAHNPLPAGRPHESKSWPQLNSSTATYPQKKVLTSSQQLPCAAGAGSPPMGDVVAVGLNTAGSSLSLPAVTRVSRGEWQDKEDVGRIYSNDGWMRMGQENDQPGSDDGSSAAKQSATPQLGREPGSRSTAKSVTSKSTSGRATSLKSRFSKFSKILQMDYDGV